MNKLTIIRRLSTAVVMGFLFTLTACGGGDSNNVIDPNDGVVTQAEAALIKSYMNLDQIIAIFGMPKQDSGNPLEWDGELHNGSTTAYAIILENGAPTDLIWYKKNSGVIINVRTIPA